MVTVRTNIGPIESARRVRVEEAGAITATNVQQALQDIDARVTDATAGRLKQRSVTSSGDLPILTTDVILNVNISAPLSVTVPAASGRNGAPLIFKDAGGTWGANNITLNRTGADTFDGLTSIVGKVAYGAIELRPYSDGVNAGYEIIHADLT